MFIFYFLQTIPEVPSNPSWAWFVSLLLLAIVSISGLVVYFIKYWVPKHVYEEAIKRGNNLQKMLEEFNQRCRDCEITNAEFLKECHGCLKEIVSTQQMTVQSLASLRQSIELAMWGRTGHENENC